MGGLTSRNKGKRGEREVIAMLQPVVTQLYELHDMDVPKLQRNSMQSDGGGFDVVGLEWLALEVKFCETLNLNSWWQQTLKQAGRDKEPVLIYRQSNKAWQVRMIGIVGTPTCGRQTVVTIAIEDFLQWFRQRLIEEIQQ